MASELNLNTVEGQYALQVKEFRERTDRMKNATRKMWRLQDGFRESFDATWVDWPELPRRALLKPCAERLESSLPPPFSKSKALLELSCPELTDERLVKDTGGLSLVRFIDLVVDDVENSEANPLHKLFMGNIQSFIKSVHGNVYPSFAEHRYRDKWTLSLLIEQRSMWLSNYALNAVAEMANIFHSVEDQQRNEAAAPPQGEAEDGSQAQAQAQAAAVVVEDPSKCLACGNGGPGLLSCSQCKKAKFCDRDCQRAVWGKHKLECKKP